MYKSLICIFYYCSTPLHLSVMSHNELIFSLLLEGEQKPDLNLRTEEGHTPLWYALLEGTSYTEKSFAFRLISAGASPNPVSKIMSSNMHYKS